MSRISKVLFFVIFGFGVGVHNSAMAGASFYMTQTNTLVSGVVTSPAKVVIGSQFQVLIPFPASALMFGNTLRSASCDNPSQELVRNWAFAIPETLDFSDVGGPKMRIISSSGPGPGWYKIGYSNISGVDYSILWSSQTGVSVTCSSYLSSYLGQVQVHEFSGPVTFVYEVTDPGRPGTGSISLPSVTAAGFLFGNMRRETTVSESTLQNYVLNSPEVFQRNIVPMEFTWNTQQSCTLDSTSLTLDFGLISAADFRGMQKSVPINISCLGGTKTIVKVEILNSSGGALEEGIPLGHGVFADIASDSPPEITIPLNGSKEINITATLKGYIDDEGGALYGVTIIRINFL